MSIFSKLGIGKNNSIKAQRLDMARRMDGKHIRYVTERQNGVEEVIGRDGCLSLRGDEFIVLSSDEILLRTNVAELDAAELLSKDGVVITAPNSERGGEMRTMIVHYVYYR